MNPVDLLVAFVLLIAIAAMLAWALAFRSRGLIRRQPNRQDGQGRSIVVAVDGSKESARAVDLACRLAADRHARIILADVIKVPLRFSLDAALPELEQGANRELEAAAAGVKEKHLEYEPRIVRDRTEAGGLVQIARAAQASMVVVGFDGSFQNGMNDLVVVSELFRHTPCQVLITRDPIGPGLDGAPMGHVLEPSVHA